MPVAVYDGTGAGGVGPFSKSLDRQGVLTHGHLDENRVHGGNPTCLPDPRKLSAVAPPNPIGITDYKYQQGDLAGVGNAKKLPRVHAGQALTFRNHDANNPPTPSTRSRSARRRATAPPGSPTRSRMVLATSTRASSASTGPLQHLWSECAGRRHGHLEDAEEPKPGTYTYFCRVHPFMRGAFRVVK